MNFLSLIPIFSTLIDRLFPDKEKADQARIEMQKVLSEAASKQAEAEASQMQAKASVIQTEINSDSWAAKNWRPYLMMICIAIVGYNWIIVGLLNAVLFFLGSSVTPVPIPPELWTLVTVGLGGYIGKETISNYSENKYRFNDDRYFEVVKKLFPNGMTQQQVDVLNQAKHEAQKGT